MEKLDLEFDSKCGRPAYPRKMLLGVLLYYFSRKVDNRVFIEHICRENKFLQVFTCGLPLSASTFEIFITNGSRIVFQYCQANFTSIFLESLARVGWGGLWV